MQSVVATQSGQPDLQMVNYKLNVPRSLFSNILFEYTQTHTYFLASSFENGIWKLKTSKLV